MDKAKRKKVKKRTTVKTAEKIADWLLWRADNAIESEDARNAVRLLVDDIRAGLWKEHRITVTRASDAVVRDL